MNKSAWWVIEWKPIGQKTWRELARHATRPAAKRQMEGMPTRNRNMRLRAPEKNRNMKTEYVIQIQSEHSKGWVDAVCGFETRELAQQDMDSNRAEYEDGGLNETRVVKVERERE